MISHRLDRVKQGFILEVKIISKKIIKKLENDIEIHYNKIYIVVVTIKKTDNCETREQKRIYSV